MIFNMTGCGGNPLNFKVVGGTTEPSNPKENTIWVKTEKIGAWYFSETQPEGLQEWDVWFITGKSSAIEFNALKKNGIQVYPMSAKQCVNGALTDVQAYSYNNNEWISWFVFDGYLYNAGDECEKITGGWVQTSYSGYSNGTVTKNATYITLKASTANQCSAVKTVRKINFKKFKTLSIKITHAEVVGGASCKIVVASDINSDVQATLSISSAGSKSLDVSTVSGEYYVYIYAIRPSSSADFDVRFSEVKLV